MAEDREGGPLGTGHSLADELLAWAVRKLGFPLAQFARVHKGGDLRAGTCGGRALPRIGDRAGRLGREPIAHRSGVSTGIPLSTARSDRADMLRDIAKYVLLRTAAQPMGTCRRNLAYLATSPPTRRPHPRTRPRPSARGSSAPRAGGRGTLPLRPTPSATAWPAPGTARPWAASRRAGGSGRSW